MSISLRLSWPYEEKVVTDSENLSCGKSRKTRESPDPLWLIIAVSDANRACFFVFGRWWIIDGAERVGDFIFKSLSGFCKMFMLLLFWLLETLSSARLEWFSSFELRKRKLYCMNFKKSSKTHCKVSTSFIKVLSSKSLLSISSCNFWLWVQNHRKIEEKRNV